MSEQAEAVIALSEWCENYGWKLNARVVLISDDVSDTPLVVNTCSSVSIQELRDVAIDLY